MPADAPTAREYELWLQQDRKQAETRPWLAKAQHPDHELWLQQDRKQAGTRPWLAKAQHPDQPSHDKPRQPPLTAVSGLAAVLRPSTLPPVSTSPPGHAHAAHQVIRPEARHGAYTDMSALYVAPKPGHTSPTGPVPVFRPKAARGGYTDMSALGLRPSSPNSAP